MTESSTTAASTPNDVGSRYGAPRRKVTAKSQRWMILGALILALAGFIYVAVADSIGQLTHNDVGYEIISDTEATVDFELTKDYDATAQCMIHVLDNSYAVVGARVITIGPHEGEEPGDEREYYRTDVRTESRGVTGVVDSCWHVE